MPKTKDQKQAKKDKDYNILVHTRRMRAALHQVERVLRWDPDLTYSLQDVTANGMIRKRYIREGVNKIHIVTDMKRTGGWLTYRYTSLYSWPGKVKM
jgi:hypothetical protein